ncbi:hypothetical protein FQN50_006692 [Emmonsiellopsis sp. PD_5]|nr:hypothetical protein FQN50_006692 [Emmonsiellopsis sp. PD_5]
MADCLPATQPLPPSTNPIHRDLPSFDPTTTNTPANTTTISTKANANATDLEPRSEHEPTIPFRAQHYFFYGSLRDHAHLSQVLNHRGWPELRPARIVGPWQCKLWGDYPALIRVASPSPSSSSSPSPSLTDGDNGNGNGSGNVIHGMAYEVRSRKERDRLMAHETSAYSLRDCVVEFEDGSGMCVLGKTFVWDGDERVLRDGRFDMRDWLLKRREMGGKGGVR